MKDRRIYTREGRKSQHCQVFSMIPHHQEFDDIHHNYYQEFDDIHHNHHQEFDDIHHNHHQEFDDIHHNHHPHQFDDIHHNIIILTREEVSRVLEGHKYRLQVVSSPNQIPDILRYCKIF